MTFVTWEWPALQGLANTARYKIIPRGKYSNPGTGKWGGQGFPETLAPLDKVAPGIFLFALSPGGRFLIEELHMLCVHPQL